ncbi:hypothetical protein MGN70_006123 [Eutypa lata]|nr:hypothetical protein MGN70_006123 [Eutypa lata]
MTLPILSFIVSLSHYSTGTFVKPSHTHNNNSPTTPLEVREVQCNDESLFPGHRDISPAKQEAYSAKFCQNFGYIPGQMNSNTTGVSEKYDLYDWIDVHIYYLFSIDWILGYALDADPSQDINWPTTTAEEGKRLRQDVCYIRLTDWDKIGLHYADKCKKD